MNLKRDLIGPHYCAAVERMQGGVDMYNYSFDAPVKVPGKKIVYRGVVNADTKEAADTKARLQTSIEMNVPDCMIGKVKLGRVQ